MRSATTRSSERSLEKLKFAKFSGCALAVFAAAASAKADYAFPSFDPTTAYPGEQTQLQIVNHVYGSGSGGINFTYSSVTKNYDNSSNGGNSILVRVQDRGPTIASPVGTINLLHGKTTEYDQFWTDGVADVTARARYAGATQKFGYVLGTTGGTFQQIGTDIGPGYTDPGTSYTVDFSQVYANANLTGTPTWRWARQSDTPATLQTSATNIANGDLETHILTYKYYFNKSDYLNGEADDTTAQFAWVLFFEDGKAGIPDRDYNDFMVEVAPQERGNFAPMPAGASMVSAGLMGLAGLELRRRKVAKA